MKSFALIFLVSFCMISCAQQKSKAITEFSQDEINDGVLIDVRTPQEFKAGHLEQAINIDWFANDFVEKTTVIDKEKPVFLYCKKGGRSAKAAILLDSLGFKNVVDLEGGYDAYSAQIENK